MVREQNKSVLIVDDTPANLALLFEQLKKHKIPVLVAKSGEYEQVEYIKPDDKERGVELSGADGITKPMVEAEAEGHASIQTHLTIREQPRYLYEQNEWLEEQVTEHTTHLERANEELLRANRALNEEITRRKQNEQEKNRLLTMFEQQSAQLSALTDLLMKSQQTQRLELGRTGPQKVLDNLSLANSSLDFIAQALSRLGGRGSSWANTLPYASQLCDDRDSYLAIRQRWSFYSPQSPQVSGSVFCDRPQ